MSGISDLIVEYVEDIQQDLDETNAESIIYFE